MPTYREDLHLGHKPTLVETDDLMDKGITTDKLDDAVVTTPKIDDKAITTPKLDDKSVTTPKLDDASVTTQKIADENVTTTKLGDASVTTPKIADKSVTWDKLDDDLQNTIASRKEGGVALSNKLGNSELLGITQKKLTEEITDIKGQVGSIADEEDLTVVKKAGLTKQVELKLKDKAYDPDVHSGMGRKYLRKNNVVVGGIPFMGIVENVNAAEGDEEEIIDEVFFDRVRERFVGAIVSLDPTTQAKSYSFLMQWEDYGTMAYSLYVPISSSRMYDLNGVPYKWSGSDLVVYDGADRGEKVKNVLTQAMLQDANGHNLENTIFHIQYDYTLDGESIEVPAGSILLFEGGSISNGTITGDFTVVKAIGTEVFHNVTLSGSVESIDKEVADLKAMDNDLSGRITEEANRAMGSETNLQQGIGALDSRLQQVEGLAELSVEGGQIGIANATDFTNRTTEGDLKIPTVGAILNGADEEPTAGSGNIAKSRGIINVIDAVKIGNTQKIQYISNEYVDNTNGKITKYSGWSRTNYLSVEGLTTLSVDNSGPVTAYNCFYDVERKFISRFSIAAGSNSISVPSRARWIIVSQTSSGIDKISFSNLPDIIGLDKKILDLENVVHTVEDEINNADNAPVLGSEHLIKSGGVYDYLNYIQGTLYGGYIQSGQWKVVGSNTYKYKIIPIPNASGTIRLKAKEGTGMSAEVQCLSTHEPISDSSNGILSNFPTIGAGTSRTFTIPDGTNYLYVYWQTAGEDRSPEILEYNGLDLLDEFKNLFLEFSKNVNEINEVLLKSNDYSIINTTSLSNIEKHCIFNSVSRVDFILPILLTSTLNIICNTGYQISYSLRDAAGLTLYDSNWLNKISLTNKLYDYPTVARIILYFRKSDSSGTSLEDIVTNAISEMSVDYVENSWNKYPDLTIINKILYDLYILSNKEESATGIIDFNPKKEIEPKLGNLGRRYIKYGGSATQYPPVLTFIHMSDVHANNANILRIKEFFEEYSSYINGGVLDTGDFIGQNLANGLPSATTEVPYIIRILGNHDAYYYVDSSWVLAPSTDCYNTFFKNYIENWGVVQPIDAEQNGLCYFYKDYSENHVRLICLDGEHLRTGENIDSVQLNWFVNTLADARSNSLHVVVAIHRAPFALTAQPLNPFDNLDYVNKSIYGDHRPYIEAYTAVKNFIDAGGIFVCWLCGHMHDDYFGLGNSPDTANQLVIGVACASASTSATVSGTLDRVVGQKSQDCFNIVGIDTTSKTIKIMRIGADYDRYMRKKNTLSWNYNANQLIYVD